MCYVEETEICYNSIGERVWLVKFGANDVCECHDKDTAKMIADALNDSGEK